MLFPCFLNEWVSYFNFVTTHLEIGDEVWSLNENQLKKALVVTLFKVNKGCDERQFFLQNVSETIGDVFAVSRAFEAELQSDRNFGDYCIGLNGMIPVQLFEFKS